MADTQRPKASATATAFHHLDRVATLLMIVASVAVLVHLLRSRPEPPVDTVVQVPSRQVSLNGASVLGEASAPLTLIVFSDFQCPYCRDFANKVLPDIRKDYVDRGLLRVAFRNFPIEAAHPFARLAAISGLCAGQQGSFWPWHDAVFGLSVPLTADLMRRQAADVPLNIGEFDRCLNSAEVSAQVDREAAEARELKFRGTPTLLLGRAVDMSSMRPLVAWVGLQTIDTMRASLEKALSRQ